MTDPNDLPASPGAYLVEFHLDRDRHLVIGKLGKRFFPRGIYLYQGSAHGPGGLKARLGRHLGQTISHPHWHIDYLHQAARPSACCYLASPATGAPAPQPECLWSQVLAGLPNASQPVNGFGASDCRSGCVAHLVHFQNDIPGCISSKVLGSTSVQAALTRAIPTGPSIGYLESD